MPVKSVPTLGWTSRSVAATIARVERQQREDIAARIRRAMDAEGLTNSSLARKADVAEKTISRLINARVEPRYETLSRVAPPLGLTVKDLLGSPRAPLGLDASPNGEADEDLAERLKQIEAQVSEIHEALLGDERDAQIVAGLAARLLQAVASPQPEADEPPETHPEDEPRESA